MTTALAFAGLAAATALLRLAISAPLNQRTLFPWGTLVVNVSGSLALGVLVGATPTALALAGTGGLGAFTTFSKFAVEVDTLTRDGAGGLAAVYVLISCLACIGSAWVGLAFL